jgi:hypothetical protein
LAAARYKFATILGLRGLVTAAELKAALNARGRGGLEVNEDV